MDKYYAPELEEFHVGFEFETRYLERDWVKKELTFDDFGFYTSTWYVDSVPETEFRVKCLDKEDIESLGWKQEFDMQAYILNSNSSGHQLYDDHDDPEGKGKHITIYGLDINVIFKGYVKNKSELKKLLKQLKIIE
jgi:hypothetical protein